METYLVVAEDGESWTLQEVTDGALEGIANSRVQVFRFENGGFQRLVDVGSGFRWIAVDSL